MSQNMKNTDDIKTDNSKEETNQSTLAIKPLIEIKNLSVGFKQQESITTVVKNISFSIMPGKCCAIVGESGSGKSITAGAICQLLPSQAVIDNKSRINYADINLLELPENKSRYYRGKKIGFIFQDAMSAFNPVKTIGSQIIENCHSKNKNKYNNKYKKCLELLAEVGIKQPKQCAKAYAHQLSGGQRQRAMIAMALAGEPECLIADEPTTALDVTLQAQIIELIKQLQIKHKMAILFISHDLSVIKQLADHVIVMQNGTIVESEPADVFFTTQKHAYSKQLMQAILSLTPQQNKIEKATTTSNSDNNININSNDFLKLENLNVTFKRGHWPKQEKIYACKNISFNCAQAETLAIIGESGSGKTTCAKALMQLVDYTAKSCLINNATTPKNKQEWYKNIQMIFQDSLSSLNPRMTIEESLGEGVKLHKKEKSLKIKKLLQQLECPDDSAQRYPHQFSGGERQRLCIARALMRDAKIIILDEPTSSLDVKHQRAILDLLLNLQKDYKLSYILITHHLGVVAKLAHKVVVMQNGEIVEAGSTQQILTEPSAEITKNLIAACNS